MTEIDFEESYGRGEGGLADACKITFGLTLFSFGEL